MTSLAFKTRHNRERRLEGAPTHASYAFTGGCRTMPNLSGRLAAAGWALLLVGGATAAADAIETGTGPSDWVEGTQALDDGATRDYYNRAARLPWAHFLGDWRDANGAAQGAVPYDSVRMIDDDTPEFIEWDVTRLVQQWVDGSYRNQGFFVRLVSAGGSYSFRSREHGVPGERPELRVTTEVGATTHSPQADTHVAGSTYQGFGDADRLRVSADENTLIRFDLDDWSAGTAILSAVLRLFVYAEYGSSEVGVYRSAQGHDEPPSPPRLGIAAESAADAGLASHPAVRLFAGFSDANWGDAWSYGTGASTLSRVLEESTLGFAPLQGHALRVEIPQGANTGMSVGFRFADELGFEPEETYFRYYLRFADDWQTLDGGKLPGPAGTYGVAGWGGRPSNGANGWSARGLFRVAPPAGNPLADAVPIGSYVYHADMAGQYGDNHLWQNDYRGYLATNRWYCIEQYLQLNTPGQNDGVLRVWVDGRLAWEKIDWRWRDIPQLMIEEIWMNVYHGGTAPVDRDVHLYLDNVVIADRYIGPMVRSLFADDFESGDLAAWSSTAP